MQAIQRRWRAAPVVGLILGTGLGNIADEIAVDVEIPYAEIPYFPRSTAMAHRGCLICGSIQGTPILAMAGRCHLYEGYSLADLQFPVRVMRALGIELLIATNAAGGLNPQFQTGDVMAVNGHINLMFPEMSPQGLTLTAAGAAGDFLAADHPPAMFGDGEESAVNARHGYERSLIDQAIALARRADFVCQRGVYVGVKGPNYETRSEYRLFRRIGGDVVGMSTIPEVLAAHALGMRVLGLSTVTNIARPDAPQKVKVSAEEVVHYAGIAAPKVRQIVLGVVRGMDEELPNRLGGPPELDNRDAYPPS